MAKRIVYDGLNLALEQGTGIATYTRTLAKIAHELGHEIGVVYSSNAKPSKNPILREISFFDERNAQTKPTLKTRIAADLDAGADLAKSFLPIRPTPVDFTGLVVQRQFEASLPTYDRAFISRRIFENARRRFHSTKRFPALAFAEPPDILHCTYQLPLKVKSACNVYTLHDLVPLRLPFATLDNKRRMYRLLKTIARDADHIVTVSENSRRDIIELLGVEPDRVTNTYQAANLSQEHLNRPEAEVAEQLSGSFGLGYRDYLLFYGALEPKKNVNRLVEAYHASGVDIPLVLVTSGGWRNDVEAKALKQARETQSEFAFSGAPLKRRVIRFEYVSRSTLVTLVKGARATVFPSLYEGFGLPVLESMMLGTPVVTSKESSLPEVAGDAALLVNPYDVDDIASKLRTIASDEGLRTELATRGRAQAELFSNTRYRERVRTLYDRLG